MNTNTDIDINNKDSFDQILTLADSLSKNKTDKDLVKTSLVKALEIKRLEIQLTKNEVFQNLLEQFVSKDNILSVDLYKWSPSEFLEDLKKMVHHNLILIDENNNDGLWEYTIGLSTETKLELEALYPEDIIDEVINPLLSKKTDMQIVYPKNSRTKAELHEFILVKKDKAQAILNSSLFSLN